MPEQISVATFIESTWEDYHSPTTSTFEKKMSQCRNTVDRIEEELETDRSELTKLKKSVKALCNSSKKHAQDEKDIAENLERMSNSTSNLHREINDSLNMFSKFTRVLSSHIEDLSNSLLSSLKYPLESFLKGDIRMVNGELKKPFERSMKDYSSKFTKLEKDTKKKASEAGMYRDLSGGEVAEEMAKERKIFQLQMCTYLIKVNEIKTKKGVDLLQHLVEYYKAVRTFFVAGQKSIEEQQDSVDQLGEQLKDIKHTQNEERQKLQQLQTSLKSSMSGYKEPSSVTPSTQPGYSLHQMTGNKNHGSHKIGYLLKKSEGMLKKMWQKRRSQIKDGIFSIGHSDETKEPVRLNLLTCQVKLVHDDPGKKCFDLVSSHGNRTYHFQADDEKEMEKWISVLSNAKEDVLLKAFQDSGSSSTMNENLIELTHSIIDRIKCLPGNQVCCDCGGPDPEWLSTNLGILICLECCGIHRNLGVHVSRTQSIVIDQLGTSQLLLARVIGNAFFNEVLEARLEKSQKLEPNSPMQDKEEYIKAKYISHKFSIQTCSDPFDLLQDLQQAVQTRDIQSLLQVYAEGLDLMTPLPDTINGDTALHLAISIEDGTALPVVDFIVQNSSLNSLSSQDKFGNTALHICALMNKTECMKCILRTKPDMSTIKNSSGQTPLDIAVESNFQLCAELLKAAMAGKTDMFEHINIEWDLMMDEHDVADYPYSDEELEPDRRPRSRPPSLIGPNETSRDVSPRDRTDSDPSARHPIKPRKHHHHLTHPTRLRNSINVRNIPGLHANLTNSVSSQPSVGSTGQVSPEPPLPPRLPPAARITGIDPNIQHSRGPSDPGIDSSSFKSHRRTPSDSQFRLANAENRRSVAISPARPPPAVPTRGGGSGPDKPEVPPRPRTLSAGDDARRDEEVFNKPDMPPPIPAPRKPKKIGFRRGQALFDCDADNEDELSFREGEIILLLREEEEEWWEGEVDGEPSRKGLFPISFIKPLPD